MLVEGEKEISMALESGVTPTHLFYSLGNPGKEEERVIEEVVERGGEVFELGEKAFSKVAYRDSTQGMIMVVEAPEFRLDWPSSEEALYLVIEGVEKPGNIGAMLRTADAVGCHGVILCDTGTDLTNPNVVRSSLGTIFSVRVAQVGSREAVEWLLREGVTIVAATPSGERTFTQSPIGEGSVAVAVGNEHQGLSPLWLEKAHLRVKIPMRGRADSLNVATSAALMLYEVLRQREFSHPSPG